MKATLQVIMADAEVCAMADRARGWASWTDQASRRLPTVPGVLLWRHAEGSPLVLAVYPRPRRLQPAELPRVTDLPPSWLPVLWHPAMRPDVERWLFMPHGDPPGQLDEGKAGAWAAATGSP